MKLLSDIILESETIAGISFPRIIVEGMHIPSSFSPSDFCLLERFVIPKSDTGQISLIVSAISTQNIMYYMNTETFMSAYMHMGGVELTATPDYRDIRPAFLAGNPSILDVDTDTENNLYIYRIIMYHDGTESASSYVAGISRVQFEEGFNLDASLFDLSLSGFSHRMAGVIHNPRYNGPIDGSRRRAWFMNISNLVQQADYITGRMTGIAEDLLSSTSTTRLLDIG